MSIEFEKIIQYTEINNVILNDSNLSLQAKGLFTVMCFLNSEDANMHSIISKSKDGETATRSAIKELERKGYIMRKMRRKLNGQYECVYSILN